MAKLRAPKRQGDPRQLVRNLKGCQGILIAIKSKLDLFSFPFLLGAFNHLAIRQGGSKDVLALPGLEIHSCPGTWELGPSPLSLKTNKIEN